MLSRQRASKVDDDRQRKCYFLFSRMSSESERFQSTQKDKNSELRFEIKPTDDAEEGDKVV